MEALLEMMPLSEELMIHGREIVMVEEELGYRQNSMLVRFWMISTWIEKDDSTSICIRVWLTCWYTFSSFKLRNCGHTRFILESYIIVLYLLSSSTSANRPFITDSITKVDCIDDHQLLPNINFQSNNVVFASYYKYCIDDHNIYPIYIWLSLVCNINFQSSIISIDELQSVTDKCHFFCLRFWYYYCATISE